MLYVSRNFKIWSYFLRIRYHATLIYWYSQYNDIATLLHCKSPARRARTVRPAATRIQPLFSVDRALLREVLWRRQANSTPNAQKMTAKLYHSSHITAINRCQVETTIFYATFCCKPSWIQYILHLRHTADDNYSVPPMILQYTMHELPRTALVDCNHWQNSTNIV